MENYGKVIQVIGSTLDAQFSDENLPGIYNALKVDLESTVLGETTTETLWCEVAQHLGGGRIRAVALGSTDGLGRGAKIMDTGSPVTVPVGEQVLGRIFNLLGDRAALDSSVATRAQEPLRQDRALRDRHQGHGPSLPAGAWW